MTFDSSSQAPVARRIPRVREHHGDRFTDPYSWLSDADNPEVIAHLEAENTYAEGILERSAPLAEKVFAEMRSHIQQTDMSVPVRMHGWWYFSRTQEGAQYPVYCRAPVGSDGARPTPEPGRPVLGEQVLLEVNQEAEGQDFFQLGGLAISRDQTRMAVLSDVRGDERFALQVRDLDTGAVLDEAVTGAGYGLVWALDGEHLFYTRADDAWRQHQLWRHRIGTSVDDDVLVLQEDDPMFNVGIEESSDERWLVVHAGSATTTEARLIPLEDPTATPVLVQERIQGLDYTADVDGDRILIVHNGSHADFDLASAPVQQPGRDAWSPVLTTGEGERLLAAQAFAGFVAVAMRSGGLPTVRILPKTADGIGEPVPTGLDGQTCAVGLGDTPEYDSDSVQLTLESYLTPRTVYDLDVAGGTLQLLKRRDVPGYDQEQYVEERVWVPGEGDVLVPLSIVRHRSVRADGSSPGLLQGYGSYEVSSDPAFSALRLSMLDRGVVCAIAHVRGGGEMGRRWYDDGKLLAKKHTFTDFVACGRHLVDQGWVHPNRMAAEGGSAGGLLIGAAINLAPELFRAVHAAVPFVDALTTILDPSLPLTVAEWEEWGNPLESAEVYAYMKSYTPYENIRATEYPAVLATTSLNDTRVMFCEPAKWVQALRDTVTSDARERPVLLKTEMVAGHGGRSGRYNAWQQRATESAFLLECLGALEQVDQTVSG